MSCWIEGAVNEATAGTAVEATLLLVVVTAVDRVGTETVLVAVVVVDCDGSANPGAVVPVVVAVGVEVVGTDPKENPVLLVVTGRAVVVKALEQVAGILGDGNANPVEDVMGAEGVESVKVGTEVVPVVVVDPKPNDGGAAAEVEAVAKLNDGGAAVETGAAAAGAPKLKPVEVVVDTGVANDNEGAAVEAATGAATGAPNPENPASPPEVVVAAAALV